MHFESFVDFRDLKVHHINYSIRKYIVQEIPCWKLHLYIQTVKITQFFHIGKAFKLSIA